MINPAQFPLTRATALARLDAFVSDAAASYGARRNLVDPSGSHAAVSRLSAALRRRLVSEEEVVRAVLAAHPFKQVEQFIAEVFWRTYWKGWLELHRGLWPETVAEIAGAKQQLLANGPAALQYQAAVNAATGIEAFDHWVRELENTGYLHNWARMQVASIWVFTLRLPWQLGADWMFHRLLDADPASNTLSWRWVSGLHTAGKTYLADEERISSMTGGVLKARGLAKESRIPLASPLPSLTALREPVSPDPKAPSLVLITCEDLSLETELRLDNVRGIIILRDLPMSHADRIAIADAADRASEHWGVPCQEVAFASMVKAARERGCTQIVTGFIPTGSTADSLAEAQDLLMDEGITFAEHQRRWDRLAWPFCAKGFFQLKSRIPALLRDLSIDQPH
ncbi:MAG: hypothetical protein RL268_2898 [Pseudomonadota bacterium]